MVITWLNVFKKKMPAWESRECTACANSNCVHVVPGDDDYEDYNDGDGVVDDGDGDGHDDSVNSGQPISPVRAPVAELTLSLR